MNMNKKKFKILMLHSRIVLTKTSAKIFRCKTRDCFYSTSQNRYFKVNETFKVIMTRPVTKWFEIDCDDKNYAKLTVTINLYHP